jgi:exosortase H (IPTLxxWG-CTERM-specific)
MSLQRQRFGFAFSFFLAAGVLFAVAMSTPLRPLVDGFTVMLAKISAGLIHAGGGVCLRTGAVLAKPDYTFAMEIRDGCNGINVVILLWAAILAYPVPWTLRAAGLPFALVGIQVANLARVISLYYIGQYSASLFDFAHHYLWETLIILDGILLFGIWSKLAMRRKTQVEASR